MAAALVWPMQRRYEHGLVEEPTCQRCKLEPETPYHLVWGCPCNKDLECYAATAYLQPRAQKGWEETPAFWIRGLLPRAWLPSPPPTPERTYKAVGAYDPATGFVPHPGQTWTVLYGDASGGRGAKFPSCAASEWE